MSKTLYQPRDYQREALRALAEARASGAKRGLLEMASGLGKTLTSAFDIQRFMETHPRARVLFVCDQEIILEQSKEKYQKVFGDEYSYGFYTGNCKTEHQTTFLFATFQTLKLHREKFGKKAFDYIVVDEAHHTSAETYAPTVKYFQPRFLLGMTATPDRTDGKDIREIYGEPVYRLGLYEAWARGYLAEADYSLLIDDISKERLAPYLTPEAKYERVTLNQLNKVLFVPKRDDEIAKLVRQYSADLDNPTTMIFCASIEHAERMAEAFGGEAALVHSKQDRKLTQEILREFYAGNIRTVISVNMLNEGIDIPSADVLVFLRDTSSKRIFEQQLGRGLRLTSQKRRVRVLDFVPNLERILLLLEVKSKVTDAVGVTGGSSGRLPIVVDLPTPKFREIKVDLMELIERASAGWTWTREEAIASLQRCAHDLGKTSLSAKDFRDNPKYVQRSVLKRLFGSTYNAIVEAGLTPEFEERGTFETEDELFTAARDYAVELGHPDRLSIEDINNNRDFPTWETLRKSYKTMDNFLVRAGFTVQLKRMKFHSKEEADVALLRKINELSGKVPTGRQLQEDLSMPTAPMLAKLHGCSTYNEVLQEMGLTPNMTKTANVDYPDELQRIEAQVMFEKLGRTPTTAEWEANLKTCSVSILEKRHGSYNKAMQAYGLMPNPKNKVINHPRSRKQDITGNYIAPTIVAALQQIVRKTGKRLRTKDLSSKNGVPTPICFYDRGWTMKRLNDYVGTKQILAELKKNS